MRSIWRPATGSTSGDGRRRSWVDGVSPLTAFGLFAVIAMLVCYALERRSRWWTLGFAIACWMGSAYGFLQGAWPFGVVEAIWGVVAVVRFRNSN
jgi:hypothetical protein